MVFEFNGHAFYICAEPMLHTCTECPFWLIDKTLYETGECELTGTKIAIDGEQDQKRMDNCPIEEVPSNATRRSN